MIDSNSSWAVSSLEKKIVLFFFRVMFLKRDAYRMR